MAEVDFFGAPVAGAPQTPAEQFRARYRRIKVVGKGSFGEAVLVRSRDDGKRYIAKTVDCQGMTEKDRQDVYREIKILANVNHPNIVRYKEHYEEGDMLWILMEYADGGDLGVRIKDQRKKATDAGPVYFEESLIMMWFLQICMAIKHLHDHHIVHRDLKTANIFLTTKNVVKIGDFGISTVLNNTVAVANTVCGTPYYFSPEICQNKPYNSKSDVWALGVVLYELASLRRPFNAKGLKELMRKIVRGEVDPLPPHYNPQLPQLVTKLLNVHQSMRPSVNRILESSYVQDSLRAFSQELASQTERDRQHYEEKKRARGSVPAARAPAPASPAAAPAAEEPSMADLRKMGRQGMRAALQAHGTTAEQQIAEGPVRTSPGRPIDDADDSDQDDDHIKAKETMRGHIKRIFDDPKPKNMDEEFGEVGQGEDMRLPSGETVPLSQARAALEKKVGRDAIGRAADFLSAKLSDDDDGAALRDPAVQRKLCELLGAHQQYASAVSKLVLYEASATEAF
eukprot:TRINITY_DN50328_c0_g1_i1.p1 TRINITY_DN50328_c0_g1~~TRINITY_DN50328_c0_g1_i1.p1  ORF type:complete len:541 (+),score=193.87 TRINITY_DN50328_c0_g1_i1:88-1623(+)